MGTDTRDAQDSQGAPAPRGGADDEIAGLIRRVRRRAKLSQRELAEQLGVSQSAVAKWETGRANPSARVLTRILGRGGLRIVVVEESEVVGAQVSPMRPEAARDAAGRRYPAHTFVWAEGWWAPHGAETTAWLGQILSRSEELELPRVRYSRTWGGIRRPTPADLHDHPTWRELVAEAKEGFSPPRRAPMWIPTWALADTRKSRNRRSGDFNVPPGPRTPGQGHPTTDAAARDR